MARKGRWRSESRVMDGKKALSMGILTHPEPVEFSNPEEWRRKFQAAHVHIKWNTERTIRGAGLNHYSIQVGISRGLIHN